jgi:sugar phosphate isomerase/epimerase
MEYGFVTNCLGKTTIEEAARVAIEIGFDCLEVGPSVHRDREALRAVQRNAEVRIHSFIYGRNFLSADVQEREQFRSELYRLLDIAADVGINQITTSTGVVPSLDLRGNIAAALEFWGSLLDQAMQADIRIALEFCPTAGNFALGPYAWRQLLAATASWPNFGLNYDPSHLLWQFIEPYQPISEFAAHIFSVHAKDTVIWHDRLAEHGILTPYKRTEKMAHGPSESRAFWWEYKLPGNGNLDWIRFFRELHNIDYDGAIILEHEAANYRDTPENVIEGLRRGLKQLRFATETAQQSAT